MEVLEAIFAQAESVWAQTLGKTVWYVPQAVIDNNRARLSVPLDIPATWKLIDVVETFVTGGADYQQSGELGGIETLPGEAPDARTFIAKACLFSAAPTIDDRLIMVATGQNLQISRVSPVYELGQTLIAYRLSVREL